MQIHIPARRALLAFLLLAPSASAADVRRATVVRVEDGIRVDGILSDDVWRNSDPIGPFVQGDPFPGEPATEQTEVRLAYEDDALYITIHCIDSVHATILNTRMARDGRPFDDDRLEIVIDPYHDRRSGYYFQLDAAGSMSDGRYIASLRTD